MTKSSASSDSGKGKSEKEAKGEQDSGDPQQEGNEVKNAIVPDEAVKQNDKRGEFSQQMGIYLDDSSMMGISSAEWEKKKNADTLMSLDTKPEASTKNLSQASSLRGAHEELILFQDNPGLSSNSPLQAFLVGFLGILAFMVILLLPQLKKIIHKKHTITNLSSPLSTPPSSPTTRKSKVDPHPFHAL